MFEKLVDIICNYVEVEPEGHPSGVPALWKILDLHPLTS